MMRFLLAALLLVCLAWAEHLLIETKDGGSDSNKADGEFGMDYTDDSYYYGDSNTNTKY